MAPASFHHEKVCVMDASGRLGSNLVERLLQIGYTVHAAVQGHGDLKFNGGENKKLKIFHADPFDYQSITDALKGCSGLFYAFEPPEDQPTYDEFMAEEEVRAAHNVIEACAQTDTIDKVVFTSSATAVVWGDNNPQPDLDERHWSDVNFCRKLKLWHALSKTVAEKTAWALAMDRGINMVSINGGLLMGPNLSITHPYLKGAAEMYEYGTFVTVDLNFLVDAHICVFQDVSSYGRYLCFNHVINRHEDAIQLARLLSPSTPSPPQSDEEANTIIQQRLSNKKLNKLMEDFESGGALEDWSQNSPSTIEI
ncbi:cinnamoyl-CoA reductase-like SNL6 isoform X2 [Durio zibethinus]|uniref:Cinnamoyl-CoA reductase-like SNL6 isoform X2 n=1 Tax=Durio zibethinus TaxID=66656 RepID=A0A6P5XUJ8_DURZI|nr:cinnamoyl-CoA reductase-like SNL6 isoform X2 [Durio zibethinus]